MSKAIKWLLGGVTLLVLLLIALVLFVVFGIDPNTYKPQLEKLAAEQNVNLKINGDLGWQLFPRLAIQVGETEISSPAHNLPDTHFRQANLSLDWLALLQKRVAVDAVAIEGAELTIRTTEQGATAAALPAAASAGTETETSAGNMPFALAVESFSLKDSRILIPGEDGETRLSQVNLRGRGLNLAGKPFPLDLSFSYEGSGLPAPVNVTLTTQLTLAGNGNEIRLDDLKLNTSSPDLPPLEISLQAAFNNGEQTLLLNNLQGSFGAIPFAANLHVSHLDKTPAISGNLQIDSFNLRKALQAQNITLPPMSNPAALTQVGFGTRITGNKEKLLLNDLAMTLDNTPITGAVSLGLAQKRSLQLNLKGGKLNLDNYLPAASGDEQDSSKESAAAALFAPIAGPLAWLNGGTAPGNGTIDLAMQSLTVSGITLTQPAIQIKANGSDLRLTQFTTGVFGGQVSANAALTMAGKTPSLNFAKQVVGIRLQDVLAVLAEDVAMTGTLDLNLQGKTSGNAVEQLEENLIGKGNFNIQNLVIKDINVEKSYCEVAALVEKQPTRTEPWPASTQFGPFSGDFTVNGNQWVISQYDTNVGNLTLRGKGALDTKAQTFDMRIVSNLQGERTSESGCTVKSKRIRNRDIPLRCKDNFASAGAKSCKPDEDIVKQLLQDKILENVREKTGLDEKSSEALEGLLKGILGDKK